MAIVGPSGTGKTAALKIIEALTTFFLGPDVVRKLAPSNVAARLLQGDTLHSLGKLPLGKACLTSKRGRLSKDALTKHRKKWINVFAAYIDEVSTLASDQFLQCDVRLRQAKMNSDARFGNAAVDICGDCLQLPPVVKQKGSRRSLAMPLDHHGRCDAQEATPDNAVQHDRSVASRLAEARQGFELWRSITRVVCLTVNARAFGVLSRLQAEMRSGAISDVMWNLYMDRVLQPEDPRLRDPG